MGTYDSSRLVPIDVEIAFDESIQIFDSEILNMLQVNKLNYKDMDVTHNYTNKIIKQTKCDMIPLNLYQLN